MLRREDVVTPIQFNNEVSILSGSNYTDVLKALPFKVFDKCVINFLADYSEKLLFNIRNNKDIKEFSSFAFWCRKKNLLNFKKKRGENHIRFGRGVSFHIAPSNVASNGLFTLVFGLISGCPTILRLSQSSSKRLNLPLVILNRLCELDKYNQIKKSFSIIHYSHDDEINKYFSSSVNIRVIWGGDKTIQKFKAFQTKPNCIDLVFPDRNSIAILSSEWLANANDKEIKKLASGFAKDISLFDQMACSSPQSLLIIKDSKVEISKKLKKFFEICNLEISSQGFIDKDTFTLENFKSKTNLCLSLFQAKMIYCADYLFALKFDDFENIYQDIRPSHCCLLISEIIDLREIKSFLNNRNQTIVSIGLSEIQLTKLVSYVGPLDTNRIVSAGNAINMNLFWDGYDIISFMSKIIQFD